MLYALIDTSGSSLLIAITDSYGSILSTGVYDHTPDNASQLSELFAKCLRGSGAEQGDITHLGVGIGPGSFIGTRTGVAFVNGMAVVLSLPVAGFSSLRVAAAVTILETPNVVVIRCGRRQAYFVGVYERDPNGTTAISVEPEGELPEAGIPKLLEHITKVAHCNNVLVVTDSEQVFATLRTDELPARIDAVLRENVVDIRGMAVMMAQEVSAGRTQPWEDVTYLRPAVL
jgi:tRNA threonylcarbamoyl adenosine modification protein YeaZ